jgi:hypothetical protein
VILLIKALATARIPALLFDESRNFRDIASSGFAIDEPWHSTLRSPLDVIKVLERILAHLVGGKLPSFGLRRLKAPREAPSV